MHPEERNCERKKSIFYMFKTEKDIQQFSCMAKKRQTGGAHALFFLSNIYINVFLYSTLDRSFTLCHYLFSFLSTMKDTKKMTPQSAHTRTHTDKTMTISD